MTRTITLKLEWLLVAIAATFLILVVGVYVWGIGGLAESFDQAFSVTSTPPSGSQFQIDAAKNILRARGLTP